MRRDAQRRRRPPSHCRTLPGPARPGVGERPMGAPRRPCLRQWQRGTAGTARRRVACPAERAGWWRSRASRASPSTQRLTLLRSARHATPRHAPPPAGAARAFVSVVIIPTRWRPRRRPGSHRQQGASRTHSLTGRGGAGSGLSAERRCAATPRGWHHDGTAITALHPSPRGPRRRPLWCHRGPLGDSLDSFTLVRGLRLDRGCDFGWVF